MSINKALREKASESKKKKEREREIKRQKHSKANVYQFLLLLCLCVVDGHCHCIAVCLIIVDHNSSIKPSIHINNLTLTLNQMIISFFFTWRFLSIFFFLFYDISQLKHLLGIQACLHAYIKALLYIWMHNIDEWLRLPVFFGWKRVRDVAL